MSADKESFSMSARKAVSLAAGVSSATGAVDEEAVSAISAIDVQVQLRRWVQREWNATIKLIGRLGVCWLRGGVFFLARTTSVVQVDRVCACRSNFSVLVCMWLSAKKNIHLVGYVSRWFRSSPNQPKPANTNAKHVLIRTSKRTRGRHCEATPSPSSKWQIQ
jgi:hypothetical protein